MESKEQESPSLFPSSFTRWWSKDTIAVVTGANKGIGFELVRSLAGLGLTVILTARDRERGYRAVEILKDEGLDVHFFCLDVSDPSSIKAFVSSFKQKFGVLDILVNNAAVSFNEIGENRVVHAETVIETNFYGPKMLTQSLLPLFRRSSSIARILNMSSRLGTFDKVKNPGVREILQDEQNLTEERIDNILKVFLDNVKRGDWESRGWPEIWTDYAMSKVALNAYSRILAKRYKGQGLSVNCFCPGYVQTSMTRGTGTRTPELAATVGASLALLPPKEIPTGKFFMGCSPTVNSRWWSKDTIAIVTGANKGIGFELVRRFAGLGLTVILTARDIERGHRAVETLKDEGLDVHFFCLDVSDPSSIKAFVSSFKQKFGVMDILVNNAAVSFNEIGENRVVHAETVIETNFYGPKMLTQSLLPLFRRSSSIARILNMSSRLGTFDKVKNPGVREILQDEQNLTEERIDNILKVFLDNVKRGDWESRGWPEIWTDYAMSKVALNAYSRILAKRYKGQGLSVNCFCPGYVQTSMTRGTGTRTPELAATVGASLALLPPKEIPTGKFFMGCSPTVNSRL
ncbi:hypothetical protein RJ641_021801 [Dillenia turbinata]|uniref:Uncharacterized protein n=1 Tax=Dillenia turbinata TaxID=194707 RepID=A0AAN8UFD9_9MAGN